MGVNRLFWPQKMMDDWIVDEKATMDNNILTISDENMKYAVNQAVLFLKDVGDGTDPHDLVGKVKELETLAQMKAEHYMDSVIIEDSAYEVSQGFTGIPIVDISSDVTKGNDISQAVMTEAGDTETDDRELLASFLLDNL
jgi:hypothetical protein